MEIKIGTMLHTTDHGRSDKWTSEKVTGETAQSWIMEGKYKPSKVNKRTMLETIPRWGNRRWYTEQGMKDLRWINENRWEISSAVGAVDDVSMLRTIARMIGKEVKEIE